eukprot:GDKI01005316.1.p2 GENE.GDKI01005316.1~~GDKI01005316.1.p2  ORF type:complete len:119 (+),score=19.06 GDKI01005316.1:328-684(+)
MCSVQGGRKPSGWHTPAGGCGHGVVHQDRLYAVKGHVCNVLVGATRRWPAKCQSTVQAFGEIDMLVLNAEHRFDEADNSLEDGPVNAVMPSRSNACSPHTHTSPPGSSVIRATEQSSV